MKTHTSQNKMQGQIVLKKDKKNTRQLQKNTHWISHKNYYNNEKEEF